MFKRSRTKRTVLKRTENRVLVGPNNFPVFICEVRGIIFKTVFEYDHRIQAGMVLEFYRRVVYNVYMYIYFKIKIQLWNFDRLWFK